MKRKVFATLLAVSMIASMVPAAVSVQAADGDSIRLVNGKIEVDAQLKKLAEISDSLRPAGSLMPQTVPFF